LFTFEDAWRKWSIQVPVLINQLKNYNYTIAVINMDMLDDVDTDDILNAARNGYRLYNEHVDNDIQFIANYLSNKDFYNLLTGSNAVHLQRGTGQYLELTEDRLLVNVSNVHQCYRFIKSIRLLSKYYKHDTVLSIYQANSETLARLEQVVQAVELLDYAANDRLTTANIEALQYILFIMFEGERFAKFSANQIGYHQQQIIDVYIKNYSLTSELTISKLQNLAYSMLRRLAKQLTKRHGKATPNDWCLKTIPKFDASAQIMMTKQRQLVFNMFKTTIFESNTDVKSAPLADKFFGKSEPEMDSELFDLHSALENVKSLIAKPKLADSVLNTAIQYIRLEKPALSKTDMQNVLDTLATGKYDNLFVAIKHILSEY
jgi:hypothetical protein